MIYDHRNHGNSEIITVKSSNKINSLTHEHKLISDCVNMTKGKTNMKKQLIKV